MINLGKWGSNWLEWIRVFLDSIFRQTIIHDMCEAVGSTIPTSDPKWFEWVGFRTSIHMGGERDKTMVAICEHQNRWDLWMFIPKYGTIGFDPWPYQYNLYVLHVFVELSSVRYPHCIPKISSYFVGCVLNIAQINPNHVPFESNCWIRILVPWFGWLNLQRIHLHPSRFLILLGEIPYFSWLPVGDTLW